MKLKIAYCIHSLQNSGGMERVLTTKANSLAEHLGYEVHIIIKYQQGPPFFELSPKINCHLLQVRTQKEYKKKLKNLLYEIHPDITVSMYGSEFTFLYKIKDGSKKIVEFHFSKNYLIHLVNGIVHLRFRSLHRIKVWCLQKKEAYYAGKYDKVVLLTRQDLELWGNKSNMCYIHNPLSFRSKKVSTTENRRIIAVGRYIAQKGFDLLIDAFASIAPSHPDWQLCMYGDGQDKLLLSQKIHEYSLERQVLLKQPTQHIAEEYIASSILVFPSRYEGFGLVLTEAMECGLPCIAFDCECGPREIIADQETGFLVKTGNVKGLADSMNRLMNDESLRKKMGKEGKLYVRQFYLEAIMEQWEHLFMNTLNNHL